MFWATVVVVGGLWLVSRTFIVVQMRESVVKERLGKFAGVLEPGFHFMTPFVDRASYIQEMREQVIDIPAQSVHHGQIPQRSLRMPRAGVVFLIDRMMN